jgi:hypothetical protein
MLPRFPLLLSVLVLLAINCSFSGPPLKLKGYALDRPDKILVLPDTLREISGLTILDSATFACIQDENGILFIVDFINNRIRSQHTFAPDGDYEGIAKVKESIYVLRSDGMLFEITEPGSACSKTRSYYTNIPAVNNEGLCYDEINNRLLIGCKSKPGKGPEYKDQRVIYAFDPDTKQVSKEPVFRFSVENIIRFAAASKVTLPLKKKGKNLEPVLHFSTSEIAIHPITKELFLLSSADHMLFVFDPLGQILHIEKLDPVVFNKPEGITFSARGDMLITNEGQYKKPTLLRFNLKHDKND